MIVLLGSTGYIGSVFLRQLEQNTGHRIVTPRYQDYGERGPVFDKYTSLVINCAAFVTKPSVDLCEDQKEECIMGNLLLPFRILRACERYNIPLMHISTGCLYNGNNGGKGWSETDAPQLRFNSGAGYYVGCKQLAEQIVSKYPRVWCCRMRIPFDHLHSPRNYISKLITYPKVFDAFNSLCHRDDFVNACLSLFVMGAPYGIYNMTNPGGIWAHDIVSMLKEKVCQKHEFKFWDELDFLTKIARTPKSNCVLDVSKLLATGVKMRSTQEAVEHSIQNWDWNSCIENSRNAGPADRNTSSPSSTSESNPSPTTS